MTREIADDAASGSAVGEDLAPAAPAGGATNGDAAPAADAVASRETATNAAADGVAIAEGDVDEAADQAGDEDVTSGIAPSSNAEMSEEDDTPAANNFPSVEADPHPHGDDASFEGGEKPRGATGLVGCGPDSSPSLPPLMTTGEEDASFEWGENLRGSSGLVEFVPDFPMPLHSQMVADGDDGIDGGEKQPGATGVLEDDKDVKKKMAVDSRKEPAPEIEREPRPPSTGRDLPYIYRTLSGTKPTPEIESEPRPRDLAYRNTLADDQARPAMANDPEEGPFPEINIVAPPYQSGAEETQQLQDGSWRYSGRTEDASWRFSGLTEFNVNNPDSDLDNSVVHIPGAFLVEENDIPLYDGVPIPEKPPPVWWKSRRFVFGSVATLSVAVIAGTVAGSTLASGGGNSDDNMLLTTLGQSVLTLSPTLSPPPLNCSIVDLGPFFEKDSSDCMDMVSSGGGDSMVIYGCDDSTIQLLSVVNGTNGTFGASLPHTWEHCIDEDGEIALSENSFFASIPFPTNGYESGVVFVSPRDSSGGISNEMDHLVPRDVGADAEFGCSIAVDGDVLLVGAKYDAAGSAFVYRQTATGSWSEEAKLAPPDDSSSQQFGSSVSVKDNLAIVAARGDVEADGAVHVYEYDPSSNSWEWLVNSTLTNKDCDGEFGASLAMAADDGLLIGCPTENDFQGAVYYYQRSSEGRIYNLVQKITAKGQRHQQFGESNNLLGVNSRGDLIAVGAVGAHGTISEQDQQVYVFANLDNVWREVARIDSPKGDYFFGKHIAISQDRIMIVSWQNTYSYELACVV